MPETINPPAPPPSTPAPKTVVVPPATKGAPPMPPGQRKGIPESARAHDAPDVRPEDMATDDDMAALADSINQDAPAPSTEANGEPPVEVVDATPKPADTTVKPAAESPKTTAKAEPPKPVAEPASKDDATAPADAAHDAELEKLANDPRAPKRLREAYKAGRASIARLTTERDAARKELESAKGDPAAAKALSERLELVTKRAEEAEAKLAFTDYSQSAEFQASYRKPYEAAVSEAYAGLRDIPAADGSAVTEAQVQSLLMAGEREAYRMIDKIFDPADARMATRLVMDVYQKNRDMSRKLDTERQRAADLRKENDAKRAETNARYERVFEAATKRLAERDPDTYELEPSDTERAALVDEGYKYVDAAFKPPANLSVDQVAILRADVRHRAGILPSVLHRWKADRARVAELEAELARYKQSAPGRGEPATAPDERAPDAGTLEGAFRTLDELSERE